MSFYSGLASTAQRLLASKGRDVVRRRTTAGSYNPATGKSANTTADVTFKGVMLAWNREDATEKTDTLVTQTEKKMLLEAAGSPQMSDLFIVGGVTYAIIGIEEINPAGTAVIFVLHLKS